MAGSLILTYHSLDTSGSVISVTPAQFRSHMEWLADSGLQVVPLTEVAHRSGSVAITFDDGFRNFHEHAFPVLQARRWPATVFIVTGHCGTDNNWASQKSGIVPVMPLMSWSEVREIARGGISLGGHTSSHPRLTEIPAEEIVRELRECRVSLEDKAGQPVKSFAYPYGNVNAMVRNLAAEQFCVACGTQLDYLRGDCDLMRLPRLDMYYFRQPWMFRQIARATGECYVRLRRSLRQIREQ